MHCTSSKPSNFILHGRVVYMQRPSVQRNLTIQLKD
jgi:hypothetical protein